MEIEKFVKRYSLDRKNSTSLKWDLLEERFGNPNLIPMWVADMDFRTAECVTDALHRRVSHGVYGYAFIPQSYYDAYFDWMESHYRFRPKKEWVRLATGVVAALYWFVNCYTKPGDHILISTPVYYPFAGAINDCGRKAVYCDLLYEKGHFSFDFEAFEKAIVENDVKMYILCSPHNPCGRVWTEEELDRILGICQKHHVLVVADEIHQDFVFGDSKQISAPAVAGGKYLDNIILVNAASKSFNLAALIHSNIVIPNDDLRAIYDAYATMHVETDFNIMGITATEAAYACGENWLNNLKQVIWSNYQYIKKTLNEQAPKIIVCDMQGTYLPMLDLRGMFDMEHPKREGVVLNGKAPVNGDVQHFIQEDCQLAVDYGEWFGGNFGGFIRLNLATTPETVKNVVDRIVTNYKALLGE